MNQLNIFQTAFGPLNETDVDLEAELKTIGDELDALSTFTNEFTSFHKCVDEFAIALHESKDSKAIEPLVGWYNTLVAMSHDTLKGLPDLEDDNSFNLTFDALDDNIKNTQSKKPGIFKRIWAAIKKLFLKILGIRKKEKAEGMVNETKEKMDSFLDNDGFMNEGFKNDPDIKPKSKTTAQMELTGKKPLVFGKNLVSQIKDIDNFLKNQKDIQNIILSAKPNASQEEVIESNKKISNLLNKYRTESEFISTRFMFTENDSGDFYVGIKRSIVSFDKMAKSVVDIEVMRNNLLQLSSIMDNLNPVVDKYTKLKDEDVHEKMQTTMVTVSSLTISILNDCTFAISLIENQIRKFESKIIS